MRRSKGVLSRGAVVAVVVVVVVEGEQATNPDCAQLRGSDWDLGGEGREHPEGGRSEGEHEDSCTCRAVGPWSFRLLAGLKIVRCNRNRKSLL